MQSLSGPQTENDGIVMSEEVAGILLEALGIHDPIGKIEIVFEAFKEIEIRVHYNSHYKTLEGVQEVCRVLKVYHLVANPA